MVRPRGRPPARAAPAAGRGVDGPDAAALAGGPVAAPAEDVERPTERRAGGMGHASREVADHPRAMAQRVDADDLVARPGAVGPAGHEQAPAHCGRGGVAHGVGERGDLVGRAPGPEGQHRAQRRRRRVAADDVGGRAHRHRRRVRHRRGQAPGGPRASARRHLRDRGRRAAGAAAAEDVEARAQRGGAHVVDRGGQRAEAPGRPGRDAHDVGQRAVGCVQAADGEHRAPYAREPRQLHGRGQRARPHQVQADPDGRALGSGALRGRGRGRSRRGVMRRAGRVRSAARHRRRRQRREERAAHGPATHARVRRRRRTSSAASAATAPATARMST